MTDPSLWRAIGAALSRERQRRHWTLREVMRRGGPNFATVQAHERGQIRTTAALTEHLAVFRWRLFDVILVIAREHPAVASSDVLSLVNAFETATDDARNLLTQAAALLPQRDPAAPTRSRTSRPAPGDSADDRAYSVETSRSIDVHRPDRARRWNAR